MLSKLELTWLEKHANNLLLLIPLFLCILLFIWGFLTNSPLIQSAIFGISGTLLGASLGTWLSLLANARQHRNVEEALEMLRNKFLELQKSVLELPEKVVKFPMLSPEQSLAKYRTVFHKYHKTRHQGEEFWIYSMLDFSQDFEPGRLRAKTSIPIDGTLYQYNTTGYFLTDRFILTLEGVSHGEHPSIEIYPTFGTFLNPKAGFWGIHIHLDWDNKDGVDPGLIVSAPYPGTEQQGRQSETVCEDLDKRWADKRLPAGILSH